MYRTMRKLILLLALVTITKGVQAQSVISTYNFERVGQFHQYNPAAYQPYRAVVGIPAINGIGIYVQNDAFSPGELLGTETTANEDIEAVLDKLDRGDRMLVDYSMDLIYVGFRSGRSYWTIGTQLRTTVNFEYPTELLHFLYYGPEDSKVNGTLEMEGNQTSGNAYISYHVGYQREMMDSKLRIGGRLKYLSGLGHFSVNRLNVNGQFSTNEWIIDSDIAARFAVADTSVEDLDPVSLLFTDNRGFAVDLGASYEILPNLELSLSVLDIGGIQWTTNTNSFTSSGQYIWQGAKWSYGDSSGFDGEEILDTLTTLFGIEETQGESFWANLPRSYVVGGRYDLGPKHGFGATYQLNQWNSRLYHNYGVSYIGNWSKWFSAMVNYSIMNGDYVNLGLGFSANIGPIQLYMLTDDVLTFQLDPDHMKTVSFRFGMNVALFRKDLRGYEKPPVVESIPLDMAEPNTLPEATESARDTLPEPVEEPIEIEETLEPEESGQNVEMAPEVIDEGEKPAMETLQEEVPESETEPAAEEPENPTSPGSEENPQADEFN